MSPLNTPLQQTQETQESTQRMHRRRNGHNATLEAMKGTDEI